MMQLIIINISFRNFLFYLLWHPRVEDVVVTVLMPTVMATVADTYKSKI